MVKVFAILGLLFFLSAQQVAAHGAGLVPFFKINGKLPGTHPLEKQSVYPASFTIPQDVSYDTYLVNEPVSFVIDTNSLAQVYPEDTLNKISYNWDYGDGVKASGLTNTHTYAKMGSYRLTIYADFQTEDISPQLIESVQLNILPQKGYVLPQPRILIDRQQVGEEIIPRNLQNPVRFDVSIKKAPNTEISYLWDLGDGKSSTKKTLVYTYDSEPALMIPALRVKDSNGFITDTFVLLKNNKDSAGYTFSTEISGITILVVEGLAILVGGILFFIVMRKKRAKPGKE